MLVVYNSSPHSLESQAGVQLKQDLVTDRLPCLKQKTMHQTAMAQGVCIASSKAVDAAAAAASPATAALQLSAAGHHEDAAKVRPQLFANSACHSAESLVEALASTAQSKDTHMIVV